MNDPNTMNNPGAIQRRGLMLVLSSPSGAGKTTIARALVGGDHDLTLSVSATTRPPRRGEVEGRDYRFIDPGAFDRMVIEGAFLEHARVFDFNYGTPKAPVEEALAKGSDILFDVDWQGAQKLKDNAGADVVSIFILPPSVEELERRLHARAQDSERVVRKRMAGAVKEMSHWGEYDYVIVNDDMDRSVALARSILAAERLRRDRRTGMEDFVAGLSGK